MNQEVTKRLEPNEADSSLPAENGNEDYYDEPGKIQRTLEYMETERGHEVTLRFVSILEQLSPAIKMLLEAKIQAERTRPMWDFRKWLSLLIVRLLVFIVGVVALIYMRKVGTIDPAIALLIGSLVAYFFGYNRSQS